MGTGGDGSAATALLSVSLITDASGSFNLAGAYSCPNAQSLVYIVASGGNPGLAAGTTNATISLMAALGSCGSLTASTPIVINEPTTVAAVYELAPYMNSTSAIGSAGSDAAALASGFTTAAELVSTATGTSPGTGVPAGTTLPIPEVNSLANLLAGCVESTGGVAGDGSDCGTLFALTTQPGTTAANNTALALLYLANNPGMNTAALFSLSSSNTSF